MMLISWLLNIGFYAVFSFSPAPPAASKAEPVCGLEVRLNHAEGPYKTLHTSVCCAVISGKWEGGNKESNQVGTSPG